MKFPDALNIEDLRTIARRRLPRMVFDAIEGGSDDEITLSSNHRAFERLTFRPKAFADVQRRDQSISLFGNTFEFPVLFGPTGSGRLAAPGAELALARVAARAGTTYVHGSVGSFLLEDVARAGAGHVWYQLYLPPDRDRATKMMAAARNAGCGALVLTIDTAVRSSRERDARNGFQAPYRITPRLLAQGMTRPTWSIEFVLANLRDSRSGATKARHDRVKQLSLKQVESAIISARWPATWEDLKFVRDTWAGPLIVKGILRPDECDELIAHGVDGIIVSNHGGRQLDGAPATIDVLPAIAKQVGGRMAVLLDGGIRRGSDVVKAMALGATACLVGRPYIYALAAGREAGLDRLVTILREEIDRTMALIGCATLSSIDASYVAEAGGARS